MFFLLPSGGITLGKEEDLLNLLFLKLKIILIIKKPGVTHFSFRITAINILDFFTFDKIHEIKNLPLWFDEWWKLFGAETSILPSLLCNKLLEYSKNFPSPSPFNLFSPELYFFLHFNIPWILSWDYNFVSLDENIYNPQCPDHSIKYIVRTISIKWWDKYDYDDIITKIIGLSTNQF